MKQKFISHKYILKDTIEEIFNHSIINILKLTVGSEGSESILNAKKIKLQVG